ncbi:hypothetical protein [uncultured Microscilla sp.]|uniref:hypothetical protein n=1 Tax=uncultured Microscilla sp. TaxID=432653 RepID=UPI002617389B|nr:hypothetical protein [uncultured Microscilla sp.]
MLTNQLQNILENPMDVYIEIKGKASIGSASKANALKFHPTTGLISLFVCNKYLQQGISGWKSRPSVSLIVQHPMGFQKYELQCEYVEHHKTNPREKAFQEQYTHSLNQILKSYGIPTEVPSNCMTSCQVITLKIKSVKSKIRMR